MVSLETISKILLKRGELAWTLRSRKAKELLIESIKLTINSFRARNLKIALLLPKETCY